MVIIPSLSRPVTTESAATPSKRHVLGPGMCCSFSQMPYIPHVCERVHVKNPPSRCPLVTSPYPVGHRRHTRRSRWSPIMCNRVLIKYPVRSSPSLFGVRERGNFVFLLSSEITLSNTVGTDWGSGWLWGYQSWRELGESSCHFMTACVCVWGGLDLLAQFVLSFSSELEKGPSELLYPLFLSLSFCRIGREWSVSLSYSGWPWLWFAVSLNKDDPHPFLLI